MPCVLFSVRFPSILHNKGLCRQAGKQEVNS